MLSSGGSKKQEIFGVTPTSGAVKLGKSYHRLVELLLRALELAS